MNPMTRRLICGAIVYAAAWLAGADAMAQGLSGGVPGAGLAGGGVASPGVQATPLGVPMVSPTLPNAGGSVTGSPLSTASPGGVYTSPLATPFVYNNMLQASQAQQGQASLYYGPNGLATTQLGLLLLANQQQNGGIGSGRISGTRGDSRARDATAARTPATSSQRAPARPGGLASRYFNRAAGHTAYPQQYFHRQSRYFP
jgi:hypothetical protein